MELTLDISLREFFIASNIERLVSTVNSTMKGMIANIIRVRTQFILTRIMNAPMNISTARNRFSGP